ncbi:hypothetical protein HYT23_01160 [Candidatus Pacearchaeota archaeon]|nr:hypothetical protein [Candidatus Pacearchaeota archaeon]
MAIKKTLSLIISLAFFVLASVSPVFGAISPSGNTFDVSVNVEKPIPEYTPLYPELPVIVDEDVMPVPYAYYDYDKDGKIDWIRKEHDGNYYVYKNKGTNENQIYREGTEISSFEGNNLIENYGVKSISGINIPAETQSWNYFSHPRYDLYIDSAYYAANTPAIDNFFNEFDERFGLLEATTGWSSEEYYGTKLRINVTSTPVCAQGKAYAGEIYLNFSNTLYDSGCTLPYYENGIPYLGNPGELGDNWLYMKMAIHESLHSINPTSILTRLWFTEGFSRYYEYNILSNYNGNGFLDINQETADTYLYIGNSFYNWANYVSNNYHDTTPQNNPIQSSLGYAITAWMFSMMRDNHSLSWSNLYTLINNNRETVDKAWSLAAGNVYDADMFNIDLFGRASGLTFNQTKAIWRYDGPSGPGWGVRNWTDVNGVIAWYADLTPTSLVFSKTNPVAGELVQATATISNAGQTNANNVSVRFYKDTTTFIGERYINVNAGSNGVVGINFTAGTGTHQISVKVDEFNTKIETNDLNNIRANSITFSAPPIQPSCVYNKKLRAYVCS